MSTIKELVGLSYWLATNFPQDVNPFTPEKFLTKKVNDLEWGLHGGTIDMMKKSVSQNMSLMLASQNIELGWPKIFNELLSGTQNNKTVINDLSKEAVDNRPQ